MPQDRSVAGTHPAGRSGDGLDGPQGVDRRREDIKDTRARGSRPRSPRDSLPVRCERFCMVDAIGYSPQFLRIGSPFVDVQPLRRACIVQCRRQEVDVLHIAANDQSQFTGAAIAQIDLRVPILSLRIQRQETLIHERWRVRKGRRTSNDRRVPGQISISPNQTEIGERVWRHGGTRDKRTSETQVHRLAFVRQVVNTLRGAVAQCCDGIELSAARSDEAVEVGRLDWYVQCHSVAAVQVVHPPAIGLLARILRRANLG